MAGITVPSEPLPMKPIRTTRPALACIVAALGCVAAGTALAQQYKVIGSDGRVTYTDREPTAAAGRVVPIGGRAAAEPTEPELPFELRQAASRYPVTLYTTSNACEPCTSGRTMLRQRGVPFSERQVVSNADSEALEKITGGREVPALTIGSQTLRGFSAEAWSPYLDAAGYPRDSVLPPTWSWRAATPIVEKREVQPNGAPTRAAATATPARPTATPAGAGGIRF